MAQNTERNATVYGQDEDGITLTRGMIVDSFTEGLDSVIAGLTDAREMWVETENSFSMIAFLAQIASHINTVMGPMISQLTMADHEQAHLAEQIQAFVASIPDTLPEDFD